MTKEIKTQGIILPTAFLGGVWQYALYFKGNVLIEANENYQKRSTRNKCVIKTSQGKKSCSIPLKSGKNQQQAIKDVQISYEELWIKDFKHSIETNYSGAPYIDYYFPEMMKIINKEPDHLWNLNWDLNALVLKFLGIEEAPAITQEWISNYGSNHKDYRKGTPRFELDYQYPQLFEEKGQAFMENLSILDLLFCCGPEARIHLMNMAEKIKA